MNGAFAIRRLPLVIKGFTFSEGESLSLRGPSVIEGFKSHVAVAETAPLGVPPTLRGPILGKGFY